MGASLLDDAQPVSNFADHISSMEGFHRRYMVSKKVTHLWANMVREMDVEMIVPQHGRSFKGKEMINAFLTWVESFDCGIDLLQQQNYREPK